MDGNVMADPDSKPYDALDLRNISSSLFNIPGFLAGFSTKGPLDFETVRSPTSPLDLRVFANFSNPFSVRSPRSSPPSSYQNNWDCSKTGLGILNLLADETKSDVEDFDSPKRTILFGSQVKKTKFPHSSRYSNEFLGNSMKSNSLPRNYIISQLFQAKNPNKHSEDSSLAFENEKGPLEPKPDSSQLSSSLIASTRNSDLSSRSFCPENGTSNINSSSLPVGRASQADNSLVSKPSSLPMPIGHSMREIELSEDYTCIISHGPNPKTIHIFGDRVLECHNNELTDFEKKFEPGSKVTHLDKSTETSILYPSDEFLRFCYTCNKKLEKEDDIYMYRGEKAFCSFDCRSEEIFAEESEKAYNNSSNDSPDQSDDEDLFLLGAPMNM